MNLFMCVGLLVRVCENGVCVLVNFVVCKLVPVGVPSCAMICFERYVGGLYASNCDCFGALFRMVCGMYILLNLIITK